MSSVFLLVDNSDEGTPVNFWGLNSLSFFVKVNESCEEQARLFLEAKIRRRGRKEF